MNTKRFYRMFLLLSVATGVVSCSKNDGQQPSDKATSYATILKEQEAYALESELCRIEVLENGAVHVEYLRGTALDDSRQWERSIGVESEEEARNVFLGIVGSVTDDASRLLKEGAGLSFHTAGDSCCIRYTPNVSKICFGRIDVAMPSLKNYLTTIEFSDPKTWPDNGMITKRLPQLWSVWLDEAGTKFDYVRPEKIGPMKYVCIRSAANDVGLLMGFGTEDYYQTDVLNSGVKSRKGTCTMTDVNLFYHLLVDEDFTNTRDMVVLPEFPHINFKCWQFDINFNFSKEHWMPFHYYRTVKYTRVSFNNYKMTTQNYTFDTDDNPNFTNNTYGIHVIRFDKKTDFSETSGWRQVRQ